MALTKTPIELSSTPGIVDNSNATAITIDSSENVTLTGEIIANGGIALPDSQKATFGAGDDLKIHHNGSNSFIQDSGTGDLIIAGTNLSLRNYATDEIFLDGTSNAAVRVFYNGAAKLATTNTGIDVTGTASATSVTAAQHLTAGSAYSVLFGDGGERISGNNSSSLLSFFTGATERMRIDSSGNLLVGKTASNATTAGVELAPNGIGVFTYAGRPLYLNRLASDGNIIDVARQGTTVGSIGVVNSNNPYFTSASRGIRIAGNNIRPCSTGGANLDNTISLGDTGQRFKDLYLSSGVYLGGTGAANKLDDYEEGTWTPSLDASSTDPSLSYAVQVGAYEKIGALVHASFFINVSAVNSQGSGTLRIAGLPFNASNNTNANEVPAVLLQTEPFNAGDGAGYQQFARTVGSSALLLLGYKTGNGGSVIPAGANNVGTGYLIGHVVYRTLS